MFIASPGDVSVEREALAGLIAELNQVIDAVAPEKKISLEAVDWKKDAVPSGGRPQEVINKYIGEYDILVGVMWTRFGTPSGVAGSGTAFDCTIMPVKVLDDHGFGSTAGIADGEALHRCHAGGGSRLESRGGRSPGEGHGS